MKKMIYISVLFLIAAGGIFWSCQKEEFAGISDEELALKKAKVTTAVATTFTWTESVCAGDPITFTLTGDGQKQIRMWGLNTTTNEYEWLQVANAGSNNSDPLYFNTVLEAGTYYFLYKVGNNWYPGNASTEMMEGIEVEIVDCCTPGFTYVDNGDKTYTFTLVPDEDTEDALLEFTFAQGVAVSGLTGFTQNGKKDDPNSSVWSATMDLNECETYSWTVTLVADCNGNSASSNVWTDFKVNDISLKANQEDKFIQVCPKD